MWFGKRKTQAQGQPDWASRSQAVRGEGAPLRTSDQVVSLSFPRENLGALADAARHLMPEQTSD